MSSKHKQQFDKLSRELNDSSNSNKNEVFKKFGKLMSQLDSHDALEDSAEIKYDYEIYQSIWPDADKLRKSGKLLKMGQSIKCPVIAIHGDKDTLTPIPA